MTEKFCKDCKEQQWNPATGNVMCHLLPEWAFIPSTVTHYCTLGRQIMAEEEKRKLAAAYAKHIAESFEVKTDE